MSRRVAWAIVIVTWTILLLGGGLALLAIRQTVLASMDDSVSARAAALSGLIGAGAVPGPGAIPPGDRYVVVLDDGRTLARSGSTANESLTPSQAFAPASAEAPRPPPIDRRTITLADGRRLRSLTLRAEISDPQGNQTGATIVYSTPTARAESIVWRVALVLVVIGAASAVATFLVAGRVARKALTPVTRAADTIANIDDRSLDRRIDEAAMPSELQPVARRLNEMLARLETSATQRRRFLADAAHELRTPVAAVMTTLELANRRPRPPEAMRGLVDDALASAKSMRRLVDALLEHARGDLSEQEPARVVDVALLLAESAALADAIAAGREVQVVRDWPAPLHRAVHPRRLRSVLNNLLTNAVEYNRPGGKVVLHASGEMGNLFLRISDTGLGINAADLAQIFEPFYRPPQSDADDGAHHGLGLFLTQSHVRSMGGTIRVDSQVGLGTTFEITLPAPAGLEANTESSDAHRSGPSTTSGTTAGINPGHLPVAAGSGAAEPF